MREKHHEDDDYIDKCIEECHSFVSEFEEKKIKKRREIIIKFRYKLIINKISSNDSNNN